MNALPHIPQAYGRDTCCPFCVRGSRLVGAAGVADEDGCVALLLTTAAAITFGEVCCNGAATLTVDCTTTGCCCCCCCKVTMPPLAVVTTEVPAPLTTTPLTAPLPTMVLPPAAGAWLMVRTRPPPVSPGCSSSVPMPPVARERYYNYTYIYIINTS